MFLEWGRMSTWWRFIHLCEIVLELLGCVRALPMCVHETSLKTFEEKWNILHFFTIAYFLFHCSHPSGVSSSVSCALLPVVLPGAGVAHQDREANTGE